jgi:hypothetical protein
VVVKENKRVEFLVAKRQVPPPVAAAAGVRAQQTAQLISDINCNIYITFMNF